MAQKHFDARIQWKRDTSSNWTANNPVLLNGEIIIVDTESGEIRFKIGDGTKTYTQLPFEDEVIRNLINTKADKTIVDELSTGVVYHNQQQSLTEEQKLQARVNIGAADVSVEEKVETKLPAPETAAVGQFIKVSVVDESGKITATEAVDEPDEDDALELVAELGLAEPMTDDEGNVLTDENGVLFLL